MKGLIPGQRPCWPSSSLLIRILFINERCIEFKEMFDENMAAVKTDLPNDSDSDKQFYNKRLN